MNVLHVIPSMDPGQGGVCQGIRNLIPPLQSLGICSEVLCLDEPDADFVTNQGFAIHALGAARGPWAFHAGLPAWSLQNLPKYDAVIIHGLWLYHSFAVTRAIRQLRKMNGRRVPRAFVMPHGMLDPWFQRDRSRRVKAWRNWLYWKSVEQRVVAEADGLLFTCQKELQLARETFRPYRPRREMNVGFGVAEPPAFTVAMQTAFRNVCPELGPRPYLLFLSRLHPKKGVDLLLRGYARVAAESGHQRPIPALVIAGPTDSAYASEMQQLAHKMKLTRCDVASREGRVAAVHFTGMLKGDAKWGSLYGCEAFALPSHQENFGIAVVEALACGRPVLISDQVNICNDIQQNSAAFVEPDTLDGCFRLLQAWLKLPNQETVDMGSRATACFHRNYSTKAAATRLVTAIAKDRN